MNFFAMDQGTMLEYFCLQKINHKVGRKQQTRKKKIGINGKYGHFKTNRLI